jgi:hypothetical protein
VNTDAIRLRLGAKCESVRPEPFLGEDHSRSQADRQRCERDGTAWGTEGADGAPASVLLVTWFDWVPWCCKTLPTSLLNPGCERANTNSPIRTIPMIDATSKNVSLAL